MEYENKILIKEKKERLTHEKNKVMRAKVEQRGKPKLLRKKFKSISRRGERNDKTVGGNQDEEESRMYDNSVVFKTGYEMKNKSNSIPAEPNDDIMKLGEVKGLGKSIDTSLCLEEDAALSPAPIRRQHVQVKKVLSSVVDPLSNSNENQFSLEEVQDVRMFNSLHGASTDETPHVHSENHFEGRHPKTTQANAKRERGALGKLRNEQQNHPLRQEIDKF